MKVKVNTSTSIAGQLDKTSHDGCAKIQTTLYDLIQVMQDDIGEDEEHLIVSAVVQLLESGRIWFLDHRAHSRITYLAEPFPISA
jgi:hypothetical protein